LGFLAGGGVGAGLAILKTRMLRVITTRQEPRLHRSSAWFSSSSEPKFSRDAICLEDNCGEIRPKVADKGLESQAS
jgi:hypothetical protein